MIYSNGFATAPAHLIGESKKRGRIARGYRADLTIWDPHSSFRVEPQNLYHRHKSTPYLGEELKGVVQQTWLGGQKVFDKNGTMELNHGN